MDRGVLERQIDLKVALVPLGRPNRSGKLISATHITIHNTSNPGKGANAEAHSKFVSQTGFYKLSSGKINFVSWHFTVDDKQVIKHLPVNERGIHAGSGNGVSIGIEVCMHQDIDQEAANARAAQLVAALMFDLKIPIENIKPHQFWTGKQCPTLLLPRFKEFSAMINEVFKSVSDEVELPPVPAQSDLVSENERSAIEIKRKTIEEGLEGPLDAIEDDPDEMHELVSKGVNQFIE